tara:strand:- start:31072 stop:33942 length:2871 start_codon:yes stop_codon:yes gene_type:complete
MVSQETCPSELQLQRVIRGELPDAEESVVVCHIEKCAECQGALERLAPLREDLLPASSSGTDLQMETRDQALQMAMERLHENGTPEKEIFCDPENDDVALSVLAPSENPKALGRIATYDVVEIIGRGGMGTVFKAIDTTLNRIVAVKILSPMLASNAAARKRFVREAHSAAAVVHDHVITIHAVDEIHGQPYLVMQFVPGQSLQQKLDRDGPFELKEILRIARQTASGLVAAHDQGLVHRDIKPANILLENGVERVKITDFGLARAVDDASITHGEVIAGTPQYMAPEQANGQHVDQRADLFSLGSVMYVMCTGRPPFGNESSVATLRSVSEKQPAPILEINCDIPPWLVEIVNRLHAKDPGNRFRSAAEVEQVLAKRLAQLQRPSAATFVSNDAQPKNWSPENPSRSKWRSPIALFVVLLFFVIGTGITELAGATKILQTLATVFRIETEAGTLVIETADPNATVTLDGETIAIGADGFKELRLKPGSYLIGTKGESGINPIRKVTVTQNSQEVVRIGFEQKTEDLAKAVQVAPQDEIPQQAPDTSLEQRERIQLIKQRMELLQQGYATDRVSIDQLARAANELKEAELAIETDASKRVSILKDQLAILEDLEEVAKARHSVGEGGPEDILAVKSDQLKVKTQLKHELEAYTCSMHPQIKTPESGHCPICSMALIQPNRLKVKPQLKHEGEIYTCPMHPQVKTPESGHCPICSMALTPHEDADFNNQARPRSQKASNTLQVIGVIEFDELYEVTVRGAVEGRIERVKVDHIGVEVKKGDVIAEIQSETLFEAEEELLQSIQSIDGNASNESLVSAAQGRLSRMGLTQSAIEQVKKRGKATGRFSIHANTGGIVTDLLAKQGSRVEGDAHLFTIASPVNLVANLNISATDLNFVRVSQVVTLVADAFPEKRFAGRIKFIAPIVDADSRTTSIRVDLPNPERVLKPGMTVRAIIHAE